MMIIRGVNVFPTQVEELILRFPALSPHYVCEITRPMHLDALVVKVEAHPSVTRTEAEQAAEKLGGLMKDLIGVTASVQVVQTGSIERSVGKAKRVVDLRPKY
jgi:phenylacetate-CoA ligase